MFKKKKNTKGGGEALRATLQIAIPFIRQSASRKPTHADRRKGKRGEKRKSPSQAALCNTRKFTHAHRHSPGPGKTKTKTPFIRYWEDFCPRALAHTRKRGGWEEKRMPPG